MELQAYERMAQLDSVHWWFLARREILKAIIERYARLPQSARILEIGCGTGHNLTMLSDFGAVDGMEMEPAARALATERLGRVVHDGCLPDLTAFPARHYDLIGLFDVLEHVQDDLGALAAIYDRLKPGGALVLMVPANPWMWSAHDETHHHFRRYRRKEIARCADMAGYQVELLSPLNTLLFPLIACARLIGNLMGREGANDSLPPRLINAVLKAVFGLEAHLIGRAPLPFGVSLAAVLRRPG